MLTAKDVRVMGERQEALAQTNTKRRRHNSPGPSNSHSSPAITLSPFLSSKSSNALRCRAVLGRTTCSGVMSYRERGVMSVQAVIPGSNLMLGDQSPVQHPSLGWVHAAVGQIRAP